MSVEVNKKITVVKENRRLWFLIRIKLLDASKRYLISKIFFVDQSSNMLVFTTTNKQDLERVQRNAMRYINDSWEAWWSRRDQ